MECWAALSFCKRDIDRGPINPRQPKDFDNFKVLEYRQELRVCSLNEFYKYQCYEKDSELCFEVLRNFQDPLPSHVTGGQNIPKDSFPHEIGIQFPRREEQVTNTTPQPSVPVRTTPRVTVTTERHQENDFNDSNIIFPAFATEATTTQRAQGINPANRDDTEEVKKLPKFCTFIKCERRNQTLLQTVSHISDLIYIFVKVI